MSEIKKPYVHPTTIPTFEAIYREEYTQELAVLGDGNAGVRTVNFLGNNAFA